MVHLLSIIQKNIWSLDIIFVIAFPHSKIIFGRVWFNLFRITDPETIGISYSLICFATILVFIASAGVH